MTQNIQYTTKEIEEFYKEHRVRWEQFYHSERTIFEQLELQPNAAVLDLGCGCGGLGLALKERFGITNYVGVDINVQAAKTGKVLNPDGVFFGADILTLAETEVPSGNFDLVVSLSCVDWNVEFLPMLKKAFEYVKPGGYFVSSFRLTTGESLKTMDKSYQFINFDEKNEGEIAPYIVLNAKEILDELVDFSPEEIRTFGYWGAPSATAILPLEKICFAVFAVQKAESSVAQTSFRLYLPDDVLAYISESN